MSSISLPSVSPPSENDLKAPFLDHHSVPAQFLWPKEDTVQALDELNAPLVDLCGFLRGDHELTLEAAGAVRKACSQHGFFQVVNHGVDPGLIQAAHDWIDPFFRSPMESKLRARKQAGSMWGYSSAHIGRFSSKLPWKETLSFGVPASSPESVVEFFESTLGREFAYTGMVYQNYCEAMRDLSLRIMELLAISLGVERLHYRDFFEEEGCLIMRCNWYPPCKEPSRVLGTGPHSDPTSLTILHQDNVGGLEVFTDGKWQKVRPRHNALVINIGDSFMALSNGVYQSCLHRVVVNEHVVRRSLSFFLCPPPDKPVRPPQSLLDGGDQARKYPDFTWSDFFLFVIKYCRADNGDTLKRFSNWVISRSSSRGAEIENRSSTDKAARTPCALTSTN